MRATSVVPSSAAMISSDVMESLKHSFPEEASILSGSAPKLAAMTFGQRLERALTLAESDRAKLAKALQISVQAISQTITGKTGAFTAENAAKAARFLRVDPYWLSTGDGEPRSPGNLTPDAIQVAMRFDSMSERQRRSFLRVLSAFMAEDPGESAASAENKG